MISKIFIIFLILSSLMAWIHENIWTGAILLGAFIIIKIIVNIIKGK